MALKRGVKPKSAQLHLVDGTRNATRHGSAEDLKARADLSATTFGKLARPTYLKGEARKAWDRYIAPCFWLDASSEPSAIMFCELWQEFREGPRGFAANKYAQMRHLQDQLGLTDERNRGGAGQQQAKKDEFFGD